MAGSGTAVGTEVLAPSCLRRAALVAASGAPGVSKPGGAAFDGFAAGGVETALGGSFRLGGSTLGAGIGTPPGADAALGGGGPWWSSLLYRELWHEHTVSCTVQEDLKFYTT